MMIFTLVLVLAASAASISMRLSARSDLLGVENLHNFVAPFFIVSVLAMIVVYVRDNFPKAYDLQWFAKAWAFFMRSEEVPSGRQDSSAKGSILTS